MNKEKAENFEAGYGRKLSRRAKSLFTRAIFIAPKLQLRNCTCN